VVLAILVVSRVTERFDEVGADAFAQVGQTPQYAQYPPAPPYPPPTAQHHSYPPPAPQFTQLQPHPAAAPPPSQPPPPPTEQRVQCPECAEWIQAQANVCRFCGHRLRPLGQ